MNTPLGQRHFKDFPTMDYFYKKTILVTGAAGFIGSHLVDALLKTGALVIGVDNLLTGRMENIAHLYNDLAAESLHDNFVFIRADAATVTEHYLPGGQHLDAVFHLASPASPPRYQENPVATYLVNTAGTHNLLSYLRNQNPSARFLYASTSEVYGDPKEHPQQETYWGNVNPNGPRSCYDEAKRMGEAICGVFHRNYDMDVRLARIFNTYGPRMDPSDGRVIPNLAMQALHKEPMTIYGDGLQTRSYCFVSDLVRGLMLLLAEEGLAGETVNLGNPKELTVLDTAELIFKASGGKGKADLDFRELPLDDPTRRQPDISKAKELLGWEPQIDFHDGLAETLNYFRS